MTQAKGININNFTVIDVETANCDQTSVCQIGIAHVNNGVITDEWKSYVNPLQKFDSFNISIHGITEETVADSPTMDDIQKELQQQLNRKIVITHGAFDRNALRHTLPTYNWVDSTRIIRHAYPGKYGKRGYGLKNLAYDFGITFKHHDALADAKATADILLQVFDITETSIDYWIDEVDEPIHRNYEKVKQNPIVFLVVGLVIGL